MKRLLSRLQLAPIVMAFVLPSATWAAADTGFVALDAKRCVAPAASAPLAADWEKYRASVRLCPLVQKVAAARNAQPPKETQAAATAVVSLMSVSVDEHYRGLPQDAPWETFPKAMFVDAEGRCLAVISHLFPSEPPGELTVRAGKWRMGVPGEIRLRVETPTVGGDFNLPTLHWNAQSKTYQPAASASHNEKENTRCP